MPKDDLKDTTASTGSAVAVVTGVDLAAAMQGKTAAEKIAALQSITKYVGADTASIDKYLGQRLLITGAIIQDVQVRPQAKDGAPTLDAHGNPVEFIDAKRVVIRFDAPDGNKNLYVSFVSMAASSFFDNFIFPLFGMGDYADPIPMKVGQVSKGGSQRTYNFQVVE